ncbi:MAG: Xaa-Pro dipeptidase, partial [Chloroflexota bacterium]|nr:Xaa-Pro dipeptidase [Chloroflexota bacterium]
HEAPLLKPGATDVIEPGMVLAIEAPYYLYGVAAFSPEDIGVVTDSGLELFSHAPASLPQTG